MWETDALLMSSGGWTIEYWNPLLWTLTTQEPDLDNFSKIRLVRFHDLNCAYLLPESQESNRSRQPAVFHLLNSLSSLSPVSFHLNPGAKYLEGVGYLYNLMNKDCTLIFLASNVAVIYHTPGNRKVLGKQTPKEFPAPFHFHPTFLACKGF